MIPERDPRSISNRGERHIYELLRDQLPETYVVRHHFPACWMDRYYLRDAEADFVVLVPGKGLMLLEVKSSKALECNNGVWWRINGDQSRSAIDSPFEQASGTKHRLVERLARKVFNTTKDRFPGIFGHVVVYPFGRAELPHSADEPYLFWGYNECKNLVSQLNEAFNVWGGGHERKGFVGKVFEKVVGFLEDDARFVPVLAAEIDEQNAVIEDLTRAQYEAFQAVLANPRAHVQGPAGSGKTILALWASENLALNSRNSDQQGGISQEVLLLCFNRNLAKWLQLQRRQEMGRQKVKVYSFFSLCRTLTEKAGLSFRPGPDEERFWRDEGGQLFSDAIRRLGERCPKFDVILVDEAQDFYPSWWFPVQLLLKDPDNGGLILFSDPLQRGTYKSRIYKDEEDAYPAGLKICELKHNCRNTKKLVAYCSQVIKEHIDEFPSKPDGSHPEILPIEGAPLRRQAMLEDLVRNLFSEGVTPDRIAILSPWNAENLSCALHNCSELAGIPLAQDSEKLEQWKRGHFVWFSTIKAFKGLEADFVIVTDLIDQQRGFTFTATDLYVAASRCKNRLYFIPSDHAAAQAIKSFII